MVFSESSKICSLTELLDFEDAKIHVLSYVVHCGSSVLANTLLQNTQGSAIFRLKEHVKRLLIWKDIPNGYRLHSEEFSNAIRILSRLII